MTVMDDAIRSRFEGELLIDAMIAPKLSFATHQNDVPALHDLKLLNLGDVPAENVILGVASDPPVFAARQWRFDRITAGGEVHVTQRDLPLNAALLLQLSEAIRATVTLTARIEGDDRPIAERRVPIELLARNEWGGAGAMPELLAAFALPNDPAVGRLLKVASDVLRHAGKPDGIDGYQSKSRTRVYELASAIWSAVSGLRLTYAEPPASFELAGQKVRTPGQVVEGGLATCLDTALLFAAALEQAGLYPVLIVTEGHAFTGLWLQPQEFATLLVPDAAALRKRIALDELLVFETTLATGASPAGFARAIAAADRLIAEDQEATFVTAIDVRRARMQRIRPLALTDAGTDVGGATAMPAEPVIDPAGDALEAAPALPDFDLAEAEALPTTAEGRLERWQRKLLDLTTRNRLLHVKPGATAIRLMCPDPARLEDELADGRSFRIVGAPDLAGAAGRDAALHTERTGIVLDDAYARAALDRGELLSPGDPAKLDAQLIELYRKARLDLAEGGANTLFLAVGFLLWKKSDTDASQYRAPLILLPVRLDRRSVRSGVKLAIHEDEPRFNLTLLQMLRQDFELDIPELAGPLPQDASGIDVPRVWNIVRRAVRDMAGFEVVPDVMLGAFSFAKYLMWKDLVDRTDALKANPVVRHLLDSPREPYPCDLQPPRPDALDGEVTPADLFTPLPADSSQLAAVVGSARGCDFVLDGPPGTGKSQTIANMIAHNLALGRKVLFVAEKRAALDVVHRRLVAHGLGPFCLELHSNKASKQDVLRQLDAAWSTSEASPQAEWERRAAELKTSRDGLNRLVAALHRRHPNGLTLYAAIGRVVRDGSEGGTLRLDWPRDTHHDEAMLEALREAARRLDLLRPADPGQPALVTVGRTDWSNAWVAELLAAAATLGETASVVQTQRLALTDVLGIDLGSDRRGLAATANVARSLVGAAGLDLGFAFAPDAVRTIEHARAALPLIADYRAEAAALTIPLANATIAALPLDTLEAEWTAATAAMWPLSIFRKKAVTRQLDPGGTADLDEELPRLRRLQDILARLEPFAAAGSGAPGWAGVDTDGARVAAVLDVADALRRAILHAADTPDRLVALRTNLKRIVTDAADMLAGDAAIGRTLLAFTEAQDRFEAALDAFQRVAASPAPIDGPDVADAARAIAAGIAAHAPHLHGWTAWRRAGQAALDLGLAALVAGVETGTIPPGAAADSFELAYARWWAEGAIDAEPSVRDFTLAEQADAIARFRDLDRQFADLTIAYIRAKLSGAIPPKNTQVQPPGFGTLAHQLKLQKRQKPVRQLVAEMGPALTTLAPCLLMSPLSVAQYLPPEAAQFDLVIFDEASQITPWDAVGAIARGRQLVVAGDPKQMPPTSFFGRGAGAEDDDSEVESDQESILEECLGARLPQRRLTWHYRSRNESLIAFSNHRYYDGDLITFPAPVTQDAAVSLRPVAGAWARGKARTNQIEAEAIVAEVVARLTDPDFVDERGRPLSIAVITLNAEQQKLIEDLLDRARRGRPELEPFFAEDATEPVVVKNLETVQGDERDLVLLGIGYGPETPGAPVMAMNFGPLNRQGGWRRLNVAITRARREMVVFASFPSDRIDLNRTSAEAVRDLRHFLEFAERGPRALGEAVMGSIGGFESPFEQAVAEGLRARGWSAVSQIGVSRFRIDLGIVHPDRPGDYLAGVECDGASYHGAATARDRDKVREGVLAGLGWRLARVWSTDWWHDAPGALDRLDATLRTMLDEARAADAIRAEARAAAGSMAYAVDPGDREESSDTPPQDTPEALDLGGDYRRTEFTDMASRIAPDRFHEPAYATTLREMIGRVMAAEAPIRDDLLVERIARAHGFRRSGRAIRDRVMTLARAATHPEHEAGGATFLWPDRLAPGAWDRPRYPATSDDVRSLEDIALPELTAALRACTGEDPAADAARALGVRRLSGVGRDRLRRAAPATGHLR
ncbi:DUF3320 domain-containing protein [Sphingomonas sp. RP10(2022)]|uniref:DUF3320 domain-containing protein n=1 Tax=Sphingomonas liriopis TaxID=2949094 RepID=A0A9X2KPF4_9SPHN|nr:DUF3320 domain-containing protein [Sphingomonas liriopis]MCP3734664.1 DUF3320 domain-containing protein [Sphingomonas liriopis]